MRRKGQIQLGESTAVIMIVVILLVLMIVFWSRVSNSDVEDIKAQSQDMSTIEIANSLSDMPELKCYESSVNKVKCLDLYKILAMSNLTSNKSNTDAFLYYSYFFKNTKITIMKIYPETGNITLYDAKLNNNRRSLLIPIPVNIKDYVHDTTYYGLIIVEGYFK